MGLEKKTRGELKGSSRPPNTDQRRKVACSGRGSPRAGRGVRRTVARGLVTVGSRFNGTEVGKKNIGWLGGEDRDRCAKGGQHDFLSTLFAGEGGEAAGETKPRCGSGQ